MDSLFKTIALLYRKSPLCFSLCRLADEPNQENIGKSTTIAEPDWR
jgi:hypothetical protein